MPATRASERFCSHPADWVRTVAPQTASHRIAPLVGAIPRMLGLIERACRRIPKLQNAEVMRGVTGVYDMTPDSRPLLGEVLEIEGLYLCAGFSGMGFKISPAIGLVMSELLLDGAEKTVDISAFSPNRFVENRPIKAEFEYVDD